MLFLRRHELHHQARLVGIAPMLYHLTIRKAQDVSLRPGHLLPGCRDTHKVAVVGAMHSDAMYNFFAITDFEVKCSIQIGKGSAEAGTNSLYPSRPAGKPGGGK